MMTRPTKGLALAGLILATLAVPAHAACREVQHDGLSHVVCEVAADDDLRLFLADTQGTVLGSFGRIDSVLEGQGQKLAFAMNAGMYHPDRRPVGLYIENGRQAAPLVTAAGPGNFGMRPNGVFCILRGGGFALVESRAFAAAPPDCRDATQSGPLLVIDGALHPRFLPDSASRFVRNGIGISADGQRAVLAISRDRVNFHEFARLFRDSLNLPQALYFDGNISRLYAPELGRDDFGFPMGPVIGVVVPR